MSKTVHPYAHRLIVLRDWKSRWFQMPKKFKENLKGDVLIREFLEGKLRGFYVSLIEVERRGDSLRVIVSTSRPGLLIGREGAGSAKLKGELLRFMTGKKLSVPKDFKLEIVETKNPDANAAIIAYNIAEGLEKRLTYRRVLKQTAEKVMSVRGVEGVRIALAGRLGGAEIARAEEIKRGSIPLQTFRADIDFAKERAHLPYGDLGIKVWIYKGQVFSKDKDSN